MPDVQKTPSEDATTIAGRVLSEGKPLDNQQVIANIAAELAKAGIVRITDLEQFGEILKGQLGKFCDDAFSMAGALLRLDPEPGQSGS